jgi:hypothetical protein
MTMPTCCNSVTCKSVADARARSGNSDRQFMPVGRVMRRPASHARRPDRSRWRGRSRRPSDRRHRAGARQYPAPMSRDAPPPRSAPWPPPNEVRALAELAAGQSGGRNATPRRRSVRMPVRPRVAWRQWRRLPPPLPSRAWSRWRRDEDRQEPGCGSGNGGQLFRYASECAADGGEIEVRDRIRDHGQPARGKGSDRQARDDHRDGHEYATIHGASSRATRWRRVRIAAVRTCDTRDSVTCRTSAIWRRLSPSL